MLKRVIFIGFLSIFYSEIFSLTKKDLIERIDNFKKDSFSVQNEVFFVKDIFSQTKSLYLINIFVEKINKFIKQSAGIPVQLIATDYMKNCLDRQYQNALKDIENGQNPDQQNFMGQTLLMYACALGDLDKVKEFIKYHANPSGIDHLRNSVLMYAAANNQIDVIKYLVSECNVSLSKNKWGQYEYDIAKLLNYKELVKYFYITCSDEIKVIALGSNLRY